MTNKNSRAWCYGCTLVLGLLATDLFAMDAAGVVLGKGMNDVLIQSGSIASTEIGGVDLRWPTEWADTFAWFEVDQVFVNVQLAHWRGSHGGAGDELNVMALTALWRWQQENDWFADAGVGVTRLSQDTYEDVELSGRNQFALDFAVGKRLNERWELSLRYRHYSNGYTANPNPGLDGAVLLASYLF